MKNERCEKVFSEIWYEMSRFGREQHPIKTFNRKMGNCKTPEDYRNMSHEFDKIARDFINMAEMLYEMADELEDSEV